MEMNEDVIKIIIVDDEIEIARYISDLVSKYFRDQVYVKALYSGTKTLEVLKEDSFHILISDIVMPVVNGFKLLEYVAEEKPFMEVVLLTAFKDFDYIYRANKIKSVDYVIKSEPDDVIIQTIEKVIKKCIGNSIHDNRQPIQNEEVFKETATKDNKSLSKMNSEEEGIIDLVLDYIKVSDIGLLSVNQIADEFHYNPTYLSKIFKKSIGMKMSHYLQELKLLEAKKLLSDSDISVQDIASRMGYQTSQSFSRAFRKQFTMSPLEYRHLHGSGRS